LVLLLLPAGVRQSNTEAARAAAKRTASDKAQRAKVYT